MAATAAVYNRLHNAGLSGAVGAVSSSSGAGIGSGLMSHHTQLARSLERILEEAHLSGELILTNRKLKDFPKTCTKYHLADTVIADLSRNRFCELPEEITTFAFLETLLLYHNTIRSIPESVKHLTSLTYLDLRSNQLSMLPREICFLPLQVLLVSNNRLVALPDELGRMDRLTDLDVSYNQLTALPARIGELRSLRSFNLRSNHLLYLPRELICLTLISLDISNNRIASLPLEIRQMNSLVELNLENNPLTSPPASLCIRGLVHVFKFLETQASKDEKGSRVGGNYDGYTTLRRAPRQNASSNVLESNRVPRHPVDSGYSTCDGIDKRWSHDIPATVKSKESPARKIPSMSTDLLDSSVNSSTSTIVDDCMSVTTTATFAKPLGITDSPVKERKGACSPAGSLHQHINYAHYNGSSSNDSSPDQEDAMIHHQQLKQNHHQQQQQQLTNQSNDKFHQNLGNIQTYREYKEALKQQRSQEIPSVYKLKGGSVSVGVTEQMNVYDAKTSTHDELEARNLNVIAAAATPPKSIMKSDSASNGRCMNGDGGVCVFDDDFVVIPKKPIQKVTPSRNVDLMSSQAATKIQQLSVTEKPEKQQQQKGAVNDDCFGYVKPNSPMKMLNGVAPTNGAGAAVVASGILTNNSKFNNVGGLKSPGGSNTGTKLGTSKPHRTVTWNHDIPPEKLSFTMRREFDRQREETELMTQLRKIIESRLKTTLPEDIASTLTDGVILCHLANHVRPSSVASIHLPSPGVNKLPMARCRRNVDNFLEACRKIGVDEELICSRADVIPATTAVVRQQQQSDVINSGSSNNNNNNNYYNNKQKAEEANDEECQNLPNPAAVFKTIAALFEMGNAQQRQHQQQQQPSPQQKIIKEAKNYQQQQQFLQRKSLNCERDETAYDSFPLWTEQAQLTATCTKKQMQQREGNSLCAFSVAQNNENVNDNSNALYRHHNDDDDDDDNNEAFAGSVSTILRPAKGKALQNRSNTSVNGSSSSSSNNNTKSGITTLQTIVEAEHDMAAAATTAKTAGIYHVINEKLYRNEEAMLSICQAATSNELAADNNKHTFVERHQQSAAAAAAAGRVANVSKRIEFFEHSSGAALSACKSHEGASEVELYAAKSKFKSAANISQTESIKHNIFSIYQQQPTAATKFDDIAANQQLQQLIKKHDVTTADVDANKLLEKEAGSSLLLKHDSHLLTIILSCIFIVTFVSLVIFPLPD